MLAYHISHEKFFSTALYVHGRSGVNKYDSSRSQFCQWPRLVHNCNQSFNMFRPSVYFDSHQNIPASHLGIPGGIENLEMQY